MSFCSWLIRVYYRLCKQKINNTFMSKFTSDGGMDPFSPGGKACIIADFKTSNCCSFSQMLCKSKFLGCIPFEAFQEDE